MEKSAFFDGKRISFCSAVSIAWITGYAFGILLLVLQKETVIRYTAMICAPISVFGAITSSVVPVLLAGILALFQFVRPFIALVFFKAIVHSFSLSALFVLAGCRYDPSLSLYMLSQGCSCFLILFAGMMMRHIRPVYRRHFSLSILMAAFLISFLSCWIPGNT